MRSVVFALALVIGAGSSFGVLGLRYTPLGVAAEVSPSLERSAADAIPAAPSNTNPTVVTDATPVAPADVTDAGPRRLLPAIGVLGAPATADALVQSPAKARTLFDAMNVARTEAGLASLQWSGELGDVAHARAADLAAYDYFDHYGPDGHSAFSELAARGISYQLAGENLARNNYPETHTAQTAFDSLMASPGHRANILEPRFASAGVAAVRDGNMWLYVTVFMD